MWVFKTTHNIMKIYDLLNVLAEFLVAVAIYVAMAYIFYITYDHNNY